MTPKELAKPQSQIKGKYNTLEKEIKNSRGNFVSYFLEI
jgi:hypothetical protein